MTRQEVIARYCRLASDVWNAVGQAASPNDCFCGEGGLWRSPAYASTPSSYQNDGAALEWIERVVRAELARLDAEATASREGDAWVRPLLTGGSL